MREGRGRGIWKSKIGRRGEGKGSGLGERVGAIANKRRKSHGNKHRNKKTK